MILKALEKCGHEVVHVQPTVLKSATEKFFAHVMADEGKNLLAAWKGDIVDQSVMTSYLLYQVNKMKCKDL